MLNYQILIAESLLYNLNNEDFIVWVLPSGILPPVELPEVFGIDMGRYQYAFDINLVLKPNVYYPSLSDQAIIRGLIVQTYETSGIKDNCTIWILPADTIIPEILPSGFEFFPPRLITRGSLDLDAFTEERYLVFLRTLFMDPRIQCFCKILLIVLYMGWCISPK